MVSLLFFNHHHHLFAFMQITDFKKAYSRLLGEETSGNHQAYRRGHLEITILNKNKGCEGVRQELTQKTILIKTLALCYLNLFETFSLNLRKFSSVNLRTYKSLIISIARQG